MENNPLHQIMNPRSVVVAGVSNNFMKMGSIQALNLFSSGYKGKVMILHPHDETVMGKPAFKSAADLPETPELALLVTPTKVTLDVLDDLGKNGVKRAVIVTAGFREMGENGAHLEEKLKETAARHGIRFVGPNCIGVLNTHANLNLTVFPYNDKPGHVGLISQSGTYVAQTMPYLRERGIRYSQAISVGNATDIGIAECLEYMGEDPDTRAVALYIEGLSDGEAFVEAAMNVTRKKPVVALYVGGTGAGARSGMSHTGSLGGPDQLYDGIFEQAGVIRVHSSVDLYGWANTLANMPVPRGRRMAILTHSGGPASTMADACERAGLALPVFSEQLQQKIRPYIESTASAKNPVDLTFSMEHENFIQKIPELLFASDEIDGVLVHGVMDSGFAHEIHDNVRNMLSISKEDFVNSIRFDLTRLIELPHETQKPLVASSFLSNDHAARTMRDHEIPLFNFPEGAVGAMRALVQYGENCARLQKVAPWSPAKDIETKAPLPAGVMDEFAAKKLLAKYGVPVAPERKAVSFEEATAAAQEIGYPVALKGMPEGVAHKSEAGLVHLNIGSPEDLKAAWDKIESAAPGCPRLVASMVRGERELVAGMTRFAGFGPCVMLGVGGIFTEAVRDVTFRLAPVDHEEARSMPDSLRMKKLFDAQRGLPAVDRESLGKTIQALGRLALEHPEIEEIDVNPLIVSAGVPTAVDALIVCGGK